MGEIPPSNYYGNKQARETILRKWKEYKEYFDLEVDIVNSMRSKGASENEIQNTLDVRRQLIELWKSENN